MSDKIKNSSSSRISIDTDAIETLAQLFKKTDLTDIEYEVNGCRVRVSRHLTVFASHAATSSPAIYPSASTPNPSSGPSHPINLDNHPGLVKSPMVGTIYVAPKPDAPAFVSVGTVVKEGQVLAIIEAMKVMNPLKSPHSGKVVQILAEDAHPVEFDQPLFIIE